MLLVHCTGMSRGCRGMSELAKLARAALPFFARGEVVHGFNRGSKELGCPTANFPDCVVENLPPDLTCGVYCGFAQVDNGELHKMVLSIGWNPYYKNTKRTMETHIMHDYGGDFYGSMLKLVITDYIRPMLDFKSLEDLKDAISNDIKVSKQSLPDGLHQEYKAHKFFTDN